MVAANGTIEHIYSGHVGIYVGRENGVDYIVEADPAGIVKVPAKYFINVRINEYPLFCSFREWNNTPIF